MNKIVSRSCSKKRTFCPFTTKRICSTRTLKNKCTSRQCCQLKLKSGKVVSKTCERSTSTCPIKRSLRCQSKTVATKRNGICKSNNCCSFQYNIKNKSWGKVNKTCFRKLSCKKNNEKKKKLLNVNLLNLELDVEKEHVVQVSLKEKN